MSNRIDLTQFESKHGTELYQKIQDYIRGDDYPDEIPLRIMGLYSELIAELKRYYGFVDELLTYFHHTILEDESFMDLMYRMGHFERD